MKQIPFPVPMLSSPAITLTLFFLFSSFFLSLSLSFLLFSLYSRRKASSPSSTTTVYNNLQQHSWNLPEVSSPPPKGSEQKKEQLDGGDETTTVEGDQKRRRKRGKKKKSSQAFDGGDEPGFVEIYEQLKQQQQKQQQQRNESSFWTTASATQRKIKLRYDQLVKSNQAKALTVEQVGEFINCLVEARKDLQHKSENIRRSFKIKKALLVKADRSSFDRLCNQICKLEAEHKRLEEDAAVYNLLQQQLKLSPAYKTMLEIEANLEEKSNLDQTPEFPDISFEELLAQEKQDAFWQKHGKFRSSSG